jgi:nicotinamidase-related amidase
MNGLPKTVVMAIIDPQNCFMDIEGMPLSVVGATADMRRLAQHLAHIGMMGYYNSTYITMDTHPLDHISHASRWVGRDGNPPAPFTIITPADYEAGVWRAANDADALWQGEYLRRLTRPHCIWPIHGQPGSNEHALYNDIARLISGPSYPGSRYDLTEYSTVQIIAKGMHRDVEQFGVFGADVPYPGAPETEINQALIDDINRHDEIVVAGEASSHCVMDSVNQFMAHVPQADWRKLVILRDCMSPVPQPPGGPDFPALAESWFKELTEKGVRVTTVAAYQANFDSYF